MAALPPQPGGGGGVASAAPPAAPATAAAPAAGPSRVQDVRAQVDSVREVMAANVNAVLDRGERLDALESKTDDLTGSAAAFARTGQSLRRKMWWQNIKSKLCVGMAIGLVLVVLFALACFTGGRSCFGGGGGKEEEAAAASPVLVGNDSSLNQGATDPGLTTDEAAAVLAGPGRRR